MIYILPKPYFLTDAQGSEKGHCWYCWLSNFKLSSCQVDFPKDDNN